MDQTKRRSDSIIPLSREHHHALLLCLRIHRGIQKHKHDLNWLQLQVRKTLQFFDSNLPNHFLAEEIVVFPVMKEMAETSELVVDLMKEHEEIRKRIDYLREIQSSNDPVVLTNALNIFADLLEMHIRKEERQLFPVYDRKVLPEVAAKVAEEIQIRIGSGMQPKHPELLQ